MSTTLEITAGIIGEFIPTPSTTTVSWLMDSVVLGHPPSHPGYEIQARDTVGSSVVSGDELLFCSSTLLLKSGSLRVPERNASPSLWMSVLNAPMKRACSLQLTTPQGFILPETNIRVFDPSGEALICVYDQFSPASFAEQIEVAPGFSLLSTDRCYGGWILYDPVRYLRMPAESADQPSGAFDRLCIASLISRLYDVVCDTAMDEIYDGSRALHAALSKIKDDAERCVPSVARCAIVNKIAELLDWWF